MKHTPAPWKISKLPKSNDGNKHNLMIEFVSQDRAVFVAEVPGARHFPEQEANAKLIATAPELLDALKALVGMCNMPEVRQAMMKHNQAYYHSTMHTANHTIQKAEGNL